MTDTDNSDKEPEKYLDREALDEIDSREEEAAVVLASGPRAGGRSGALAFLAFAVAVAAAVHFYMASRGGDNYLTRLDSELLQHAELTLKSGEDAGRMAVAPSWPLKMYEKLRHDIALYAAAAVAAAWLWSLAARQRARRDAFLLHDRLNREIKDLRERLAALEDRAGIVRADDKKGQR